LTIPEGTLVSADDLANLPDDKAVLICTGSQGEPMAVLSRIANRDHAISVGPSDTVVLASSLIPGNETAVNRVINGLTRLGATVVHKGNALVHVSGHASAGELRFVYNLVKPRYVLPVHGEWRHLVANAKVAESVGIDPRKILLIDDGVSVDLTDHRAVVAGYTPVGFVYVDGSSIGDITEASLKDRRVLGEEGFISIVAVVDIVAGTVVAGPEIHERGFGEEVLAGGVDEVTAKVREALEQALADGTEDTHDLQQRMRRVVGRWVNATHRRRPMIVPVVVEA